MMGSPPIQAILQKGGFSAPMLQARARSVHFALADPIESPAERESGLLIPRRRGPLRFTGPVQNHVELVRRRAFIAPDHEEPLAVRRGLVVQVAGVQEEGGPIKKSARRATEKAKGFTPLVGRLRAGAAIVPWRIPRLRDILNGLEFFIHHED